MRGKDIARLVTFPIAVEVIIIAAQLPTPL